MKNKRVTTNQIDKQTVEIEVKLNKTKILAAVKELETIKPLKITNLKTNLRQVNEETEEIDQTVLMKKILILIIKLKGSLEEETLLEETAKLLIMKKILIQEEGATDQTK